MHSQTHQAVNPALCGEPVDLEPGRAVVRLTTTQTMAVDEQGLVHGGFVFGLADYAAMLAVNHPNVVLGQSEAKFLKPVRVGETLEAWARATDSEAGRKRRVEVTVNRSGEPVMAGVFFCYVLDKHVLEP